MTALHSSGISCEYPPSFTICSLYQESLDPKPQTRPGENESSANYWTRRLIHPRSVDTDEQSFSCADWVCSSIGSGLTSSWCGPPKLLTLEPNTICQPSTLSDLSTVKQEIVRLGAEAVIWAFVGEEAVNVWLCSASTGPLRQGQAPRQWLCRCARIPSMICKAP